MASKEVILVYPETTNDEKGRNLTLPLALLFVGSPLAREGFKINLIDARIDREWRNTLKDKLKSNPICVGISCMTGMQIKGGLEAAKITKEISNAPIVFGGVHPTLLPRQTLEDDLVDYVVVGEGDQTFIELVKALINKSDLNKIQGIGFKTRGELILTETRPFINMNDYPLNYSFINIKDYIITSEQNMASGSINIMTGRGCQHRCGYCYNQSFHRRTVRLLNAEETIKQIEFFISNYGLRNFFLIDDNFFASKKRVEDYCNIIKEKRLDIKSYVSCRVDYLDKFSIDFLKTLKNNSFEVLYIGVESGSDKILKLIDKDIKLDQILRINLKLKEAGIIPKYSFMAGFPFEDMEDIKKTIQLMGRLVKENPLASTTFLQLYTAYPGTKLYEVCKEYGVKLPETLREWQDANFNQGVTSGLRKDIRKFLRKATIFSLFIDKRSLRNHFKKNPVMKILTIIYCGIIDLRCHFNFYFFMPEIWIMRKIFKRK